MPDDHCCNAADGAPHQKTVVLCLDSPEDDSAIKFPAVVRGLINGIVILEVDWESLEDWGGGVHLLTETGEVTDFRGLIIWARYSLVDRDRGQLNLGLKLAEPKALKLLRKHIQNSAQEIKRPWNPGEQACQAHPPATSGPFSVKLGFLALGFLWASLLVTYIYPGPSHLFGWGLWLLGTGIVVCQTRCFWRSIQASH
jgi:hypothetical protein